jgi:hypothetical protein
VLATEVNHSHFNLERGGQLGNSLAAISLRLVCLAVSVLGTKPGHS